ncbi:hypothetical protein [Caballeronia sp. GAOx1]|uniref:hypothetical protein n=1 Tax=Caballeronia sp. GAOx1 TaxID=2921761 RepID=UPI002028D7F4|nr:hypothetical protein [Caballeronia sp. GAOx1]
MQEIGAVMFGVIIGWYVYYINRYRSGDVQFSDLTTFIGVIGGAGVTQLFGSGDKTLFAAYGIGLCVGFFGYALILCILVWRSKDFPLEYFLDGRRTMPSGEFAIPPDFRQGKIAFDAAKLTKRPVMSGCSPDAARIISICNNWIQNSLDGAAFVVSVGKSLGSNFNGGSLDDIIAELEQDPTWARLGGPLAAKRAADEGQFVIGALEQNKANSTFGQIVIVVSGPCAEDMLPRAYWINANKSCCTNENIGFIGSKAQLEKFKYFSKKI